MAGVPYDRWLRFILPFMVKICRRGFDRIGRGRMDWILLRTDDHSVEAEGDDMDFTDKRVLVTGGSRGIGFAIAEAFISAGASVAINGRTETIRECRHREDWTVASTWSQRPAISAPSPAVSPCRRDGNRTPSVASTFW